MTDLKTLAEAATPGPWYFQSDGEPRFNNVSYFVDAAKCNVIYGHCQKPDAMFIAAASPDAILKLMEERDRLREALNQIASWSEGETVNSSFDEPGAAEVARQALEEAR